MIFGAVAARAEVTLPALFSDHLVLQRDVAVPVWGGADPGEQVTVRGFGQTKSTTAGADGRWRLTLDQLHAGAPTTLSVTGRNTITIDDVRVGEVWLCSGQSNMVMPVRNAHDGERETATADLPQLRVFTVESEAAAQPQRDCRGQWVVCSPQSAGRFAATAFFFGRELQRALGVPVGLVVSSLGSTPIESWIAEDVQRAAGPLQPYFPILEKLNRESVAPGVMARHERALAQWQQAVEKARADNLPLPKQPVTPATRAAKKNDVGGLFNGKIAPLIPYAIRGAIWYQGENNSQLEKAPFYQHQLPLLIQDWRARWGYEFPFAWVQLPGFNAPGRDWPMVREAMLKTLALPKTGMAVTIDVGEEDQIHPKNKQEVGRRLSLWALGTVYGHKVPATSGPLPAGQEIRGREIGLRFTHADGGLRAKGGKLQGFVIAGDDRQWKPAQARIEGGQVVVSSPDVPSPAAARYAWENFPHCNLTNGAGLPATPFRTDAW